jgi:hypothetical protein
MTADAIESASRSEPWYRRRIDAHFSGRSLPAHERELRAHLPVCASCRDYYERHLELAEVDPASAIPMRDRLAQGLGLGAKAKAAPSRRTALTFSAAIAAAVFAVAVGLRSQPEMRSRGGRASPGSQLLVYEVARGAPARPVISEMSGDSGLAFAYANIGRKRHLLVFAVDDGRRVYWYHPTWRNPGEDPRAIDIERDDSVHEIPAAITHRFAGRRLRLFGVFTDETPSTRQIEALVAHAPLDDSGRLQLSIAGADIARLDLQLTGGR